ncbi:RNA polymerase factor sigma-54 [Devosia sp. XJ19-1]|uniref:RNA polymerase sigma-54 factor n=1 Tax=Devosia ureilytica TaxID=2952754 RepID=A0A9Q4AMK6_9HYPH|nr:RNA polymerase factor sigma-54 [Devosia ureilytica]MCP8883073.1 RNA polymerase factor sigma-54 [Devosia ureilytica]MCP8886559.1 RNA polymerase factor sigma-54 [Devosia ureilytica]
MALSPRLEFRQSQSLTLTPQLMQSIRLLQLSHLELNDFVDTELLRNPLLEREEGAGEDSEAAEAPERAVEMSAYEDTVSQGERIKDADQIAEGYDTAVENVFPDAGPPEHGHATGPDRNGSFEGGEAPDLDQYVASRPRLADHLEAQAHMLLRTPADRLIAQHLIDGLNEAGYMVGDPEAIAELLGAELADVEAVLEVLQTCDPPGIFARSVGECLSIQLRERDRLDPMMQALIANLHLLAEHNMPALLKAVGCDREDLVDMLAELRQLDPRPGMAFDSTPVEAVVPDVFVRNGPDGGWQIELNTEVLPRVLVNRVYYATVTKKTRDAAEKTFLSDCLNTANWLTKSLDQRAQTITKVAAEIVRQQDGFLTHGVAHLKPMTLKLVAEAIDMHESTVSRVTANKYMATPRGLYEMKYFFTTAISSSDGGGDHSAESVRHRIKQLIDAEPSTDILSDDTIADLLRKEQGIDVARRTVAKYREGMNIPSSVIRRRQKKNFETA